MSNGLLYHAFGVRGYRHVSTRYEEASVIFVVEQPREEYRCSHCGSEKVHSRGMLTRRWRGVPVGRKPTFLEWNVPRLRCWDCGLTRQAAIGFAEPHKQHTRAFERYVSSSRGS